MGEKGPTRKKIAQDEMKYETSIVPIGFLCERERERDVPNPPCIS